MYRRSRGKHVQKLYKLPITQQVIGLLIFVFRNSEEERAGGENRTEKGVAGSGMPTASFRSHRVNEGALTIALLQTTVVG